MGTRASKSQSSEDLMRPCWCAIWYILLRPHLHRGRGRSNSTSEDICMGNNIASPLPFCWETGNRNKTLIIVAKHGWQGRQSLSPLE